MLGKNYLFKKVTKRKCLCKQTVKQPWTVGCPNDAAAVAMLPYQWNPRKCGSILINYFKEREKSHTEALKSLETSAEIINEQIESKIRVLAEELLCHINNNQCKINSVIKKLDLIEHALSDADRNEALKTFEMIFSERFHVISDFKENATKLEKDRANGLRKVFHDNFRSIIAIAHLSPKDVLKEFDDKIYRVNQQLISNCSSYIELETQLRVQADESYRKARSIANQLSLGVSVTQRGRSALYCPIDNDINNKRSISARTNSVKFKTDGTQTNMNEFDDCLKKLTEKYQKTIDNLYKDFLDSLKCLYNRIGDQSFIQKEICCKNEISVLEIKIAEAVDLLSSVNVHWTSGCTQHLSDLSDSIKMIRNSIPSLGRELKNTYSFLYEASHLWNAHMIRVALAQKLTLAAVEDLVSRHDSLELVNEVAFNVALEQLATANDVIKLNQCYDILMTLLEQKIIEYAEHSEAEVERLNEFINLHVPLAKYVQGEFDLFISSHPILPFNQPPSGQDDDKLLHIHSRISSCNKKALLLREIFQTEFQEIALNNWRNGFLESFYYNLPLLSDTLAHQVSLWVSERSLPLMKRLSLKMMLLEVRKERVIAVRDSRLAELLTHEASLKSHIGAVNELTNSLPAEVSQYIRIDSPNLYPIFQWIKYIEEGINKLKEPDVSVEEKRLRMMSYAVRLANHRRLFEESLESLTEFFKKFIENRVQIARVSNSQFISDLKLFHEGGSYSVLEVAKVCASLAKGGDALESCMSKSLDALHHCRSEILLQVDRLLNPIQMAAAETARETGRGALDKNKQRNKKK